MNQSNYRVRATPAAENVEQARRLAADIPALAAPVEESSDERETSNTKTSEDYQEQ